MTPVRSHCRSAWPALFAAALCFASPKPAAASPPGGIPRLEKTNAATRLVAGGQPLVMLSGELRNSTSSSLDYMKGVWPKMTALNLNTVIASISRELVEPVEGKFDFALAGGLIEGAREHNLKPTGTWSEVFGEGLFGDEASYRVSLGPKPPVLLCRVCRFAGR